MLPAGRGVIRTVTLVRTEQDSVLNPFKVLGLDETATRPDIISAHTQMQAAISQRRYLAATQQERDLCATQQAVIDDARDRSLAVADVLRAAQQRRAAQGAPGHPTAGAHPGDSQSGRRAWLGKLRIPR